MSRPFWSFRSSPQNLCDSIEPLLSVYADGMASPAETRRIDAHLPGCGGCRAALSWMQATRTVLASRPVAVPPPDLHSRIALAIAASSPSPVSLRPARVFAVRAAYAAAASVTALGIALSYPLWHAPGEVAAKHSVRPIVAVTVPPPAVKPHLAPKTPIRALVASNTVKPVAVKHTVIARKTAPIAVTAPEHVAAITPPAKLPVVPQAVTPVHHALPTQKIASREIVPAEKQGIEKHMPLPVVKTAAPKLPNTLKVAKTIKEPIHIHLDTQPKVTPDPIVRTASAHLPPPAEYVDPLGGLRAQLREKNASVRNFTLAISAPTQRSYREAVSGIQEIGNTDQTAFISAVHGDQ